MVELQSTFDDIGSSSIDFAPNFVESGPLARRRVNITELLLDFPRPSLLTTPSTQAQVAPMCPGLASVCRSQTEPNLWDSLVQMCPRRSRWAPSRSKLGVSEPVDNTSWPPLSRAPWSHALVLVGLRYRQRPRPTRPGSPACSELAQSWRPQCSGRCAPSRRVSGGCFGHVRGLGVLRPGRSRPKSYDGTDGSLGRAARQRVSDGGGDAQTKPSAHVSERSVFMGLWSRARTAWDLLGPAHPRKRRAVESTAGELEA